MSFKAELETWDAAVRAYDDGDMYRSLELFSGITESYRSKIHTNMGLIYSTLGDHETAVKHFMEATEADQYLAVAFFQCGVSNFLLQQYDTAYTNFEQARVHLRENIRIDYEQLGLKFQLYSAEVMFNIGLCLISKGQNELGLAQLQSAQKQKATEDHGVIDEAIRDVGKGYSVFSVPSGVIYKPPAKKVQNAGSKDYLGKARLIVSTDPNDRIADFAGAEKLKMGITPAGIYIDRPDVGGSPTNASVTRSASVPGSFSQSSRPAESIKSAPLERSRTAIVTSSSRDLSSRENLATRSLDSSPMIGRSNTQIAPVRASPSVRIAVPTPRSSPRNNILPVPPKDGPAPQDFGEIYDDYLDGYDEQPVVLPQGPDRVTTWVRMTPTVGGRAPSRSASIQSSQYTYNGYPNGFGPYRMRSRRTGTRGQNKIQSMYEEEEEGYGSGEYDEPEISLIRVKLYHGKDTRGMTIGSDISFEDFVDKVTAKFNMTWEQLNLRFKDEDGSKVTVRDESDFDLAIETARMNSKGKLLEIWCT